MLELTGPSADSDRRVATAAPAVIAASSWRELAAAPPPGRGCAGRCCARCRRAVAVLLAATKIAAAARAAAGAFLSAVLSDGQLFPAAALALVLPIFLPITVAVVAGDTIAGEAATGTLRYLLVRPVGRLRLLVGQARRRSRCSCCSRCCS